MNGKGDRESGRPFYALWIRQSSRSIPLTTDQRHSKTQKIIKGLEDINKDREYGYSWSTFFIALLCGIITFSILNIYGEQFWINIVCSVCVFIFIGNVIGYPIDL
jgi:hypothetical protein